MDLKEIKKLNRDAKTLDTFFKRYNEKISEPTCDKYEAKFNGDDRWCFAGKHAISFNTRYGYYGNSSCSTFDTISNDKLFWKFFDEFVNDKKEEIFKYISDKFKKEIKKNTQVIEEEITELNNFLTEIKNGE